MDLDQEIDMIYQWVKTGNTTKEEFRLLTKCSQDYKEEISIVAEAYQEIYGDFRQKIGSRCR